MSEVTFRKVSSTEAWNMFDKASKRILGMSGSEFASRWDAGEFAESVTAEMMEVLVLRPHGR
jgi:hypothetical protein